MPRGSHRPHPRWRLYRFAVLGELPTPRLSPRRLSGIVCDPSFRFLYVAFVPFCGYSLNARDRAGAVAELVAIHPDLLKQRQVEIRDRGALRQHDMPAAELHLAVAAADQYVRLRVVVVPIAVAHVRSVHEDRVIEQRSLAVGCFRHLLNESRELLELPGLDFDQLVDPLQIVGVVRYGMEGIRNTDVVVSPDGAF